MVNLSSPLVHIDYKFDTQSLYKEYSKNRDKFVEHANIPKEYKEAFKDFKILKAQAGLPVLESQFLKFITTYDLQGHDIRPRYYLCEAGGKFPAHKDMKTLCAVNHILSDRYAPLIIEGDEYQYETAVIDLQREHYVDNYGYEERMLMKLSFFDLSYEELLSKLSSSLVLTLDDN
jgi:hypothetical protein